MSFHAQQKAIIRKPWIVDGLSIDQQRANDTAKLQKCMPVPAITRQTGRFDAEDCSYLPIAQRTQQALKARAASSGSRNAEVFIDHLYIFPAQRAGMVDQGILAALALKVVPHLTRG